MSFLLRATASMAALAVVALAPCGARGQDEASRPVAGGQSHPPSKKKAAASAAPRHEMAEARLPGFEMLADGSTHLFVQLSRPVTYETKAAPGSITYVLKGTRVDRRNNTNPLVTVDFNTPVTSARLRPHGHDVWFVVALRARVQPVVSMDPDKEGGVVMRIELPKGSYVSAAAADAGVTTEDEEASPASSTSPER